MFFALFKRLTGINLNTIFICIFLAVIAAVIIPNYTRVMGFFGYETREVLKDKLNVANNNVDVAAQVNKDNQSVIKTQEDNNVNNEKIIVNKFDNERKSSKKIEGIKLKLDEKIKIVVESEDPPELKAQKTSEIQITTIWDSYCSFNANSQCAANASPS